MTSLDKTVKCRICGRPYKFYAFSAADQSACPACVREAEGGPVNRRIAGGIRRAVYGGIAQKVRDENPGGSDAD